MHRRLLCVLTAATFAWTATAALADDGPNPNRNDRKNDKLIYTSIQKPLPGNVSSFGAEAGAYREIGDGIVFRPGAGGTIDQVTVILSSWACKSGRWNTDNCVTPGNDSFRQDITLNIYSVIDVAGVPTQGTLLGSSTRTFDIPFRPTSTPNECGGDATVWFSHKDKVCYHGLATSITFDLSNQHIAVPDRVIVGVAYNTSHAGPVPVGEGTPCFTSSAGCPYDALNVSTDGPGGRVGSVIDPNGIFINFINASSYCQPHVFTGNNLQLDNANGCWTGLHPQIEVLSNDRKRMDSQHGDIHD